MNFEIRCATPDDAEIIGRHRARMFQDMGLVPEHLFDTLLRKSIDHLRTALASGEYIGWLVPDPGHPQKIVAGAGLLLRRIPPIPLSHETGEPTIAHGPQGLIINVFTEPQWRRRGLASRLMEQIITWSLEQRIESLVLHASQDGRDLYQQLGFIPTNEMRLR
jgi:GNAT superfamily N-acetyltransferase